MPIIKKPSKKKLRAPLENKTTLKKAKNNAVARPNQFIIIPPNKSRAPT